MEREDIEEKVEMITDKSGNELKQTIMKMYPNLFEGLGKIPHEKINRCLTDINQCLTDIFEI